MSVTSGSAYEYTRERQKETETKVAKEIAVSSKISQVGRNTVSNQLDRLMGQLHDQHMMVIELHRRVKGYGPIEPNNEVEVKHETLVGKLELLQRFAQNTESLLNSLMEEV